MYSGANLDDATLKPIYFTHLHRIDYLLSWHMLLGTPKQVVGSSLFCRAQDCSCCVQKLHLASLVISLLPVPAPSDCERPQFRLSSGRSVLRIPSIHGLTCKIRLPASNERASILVD